MTDQYLAEQAKRKDLLGYHDIKLGNASDERLDAFLHSTLPAEAGKSRERFNENYDLLSQWVYKNMSYEEFAARVRRREQGTDETFDE